MPGLAPLALDALQHRRLFAADVGARTPAEDEPGLVREARGVELRDLLQQHLADARILVAQVDVTLGGFDGPTGDQRAFEEAMRVLLHVDPVLDRAGFALVRVYRHQPGAGLGADEAPLATGGEARAALALEAALLQRRNHVVHGPRAREAFLEHGVAASSDIGVEINVRRIDRRMVGPFDAGEDRIDGRLGHVAMAHLGHRRFLATAHAGRAHHPHGIAHSDGERLQQRGRAETFAGEAIADPDRERRRRALALHHDVEVGVEGRDLVDLGHGEAHLGRERRQVPRRKAAVVVLDLVQSARSAGLGAWARLPAARGSRPAPQVRPAGPSRCSAPCASRFRGVWAPDFRPIGPLTVSDDCCSTEFGGRYDKLPRCLTPSRSTVEN